MTTAASSTPTVNWTLEIIKLVVPPILTLFGVWIGFTLSNRGRKFEILYKERYRSTEETIGYLHNIQRSLQDVLLWVLNTAKLPSQYAIDKLESTTQDSYKLRRSYNHKYLVILEYSARQLFFDLEVELTTILAEASKFSRIPLEAYEGLANNQKEGILREANELEERFQIYYSDNADLRTKMYIDLRLPKK